MKIKKANPKFKRFEMKKEEFDKEEVEESLRFILTVLRGDDKVLEELKKEFEGSRFGLDSKISDAVKLVMCYDMEIRPNCIQINNEERNMASGAQMSWSRRREEFWESGTFGRVHIYPSGRTANNLNFISNLMHEFRHAWQSVQKERGHLIPAGVNMADYPNDKEKRLKLLLTYGADIAEFDAEMYSARMIERWLKDETIKNNWSLNEASERFSYVNGRRVDAIVQFVTCNVAKLSYGVLKKPKQALSILDAGAQLGVQLSESSGQVQGAERGLIDNEQGARKEVDARKYLKAIREELCAGDYYSKKLTYEDKCRIIDSMLVVFASENGIDPNSLSFLLMDSRDNKKELEFVDARSIGGDSNQFGYLFIPQQKLSEYDDLRFYKLMKSEFVYLKMYPEVKDALDNWRRVHGNLRDGQTKQKTFSEEVFKDEQYAMTIRSLEETERFEEEGSSE